MIRPRDDLTLAEGYHSPQIEVAVRLNTNESPLPPPAEWEAELAAALASIRWNRYPDRAATGLRQAIADLHAVDPTQVFVANGSNEVLQTLLLTYGGSGRAVAMFEPTYSLHSHISRLTGTRVVTGERADDFSLDLDEVSRLVTQARPSVIFACSPNNPTGMVDTEEQILEMLQMARATGALLVVDEAYAQFAPWSAIEHLDEGTPLVVTRTFSKTWSMAAARLGYLLGPAEVVAQLDKVALPYHLDAFKQLAGTLAVAHTAEMDERVDMLVHERGRLVLALSELPVQVWPSGANFVLIRPIQRDGSDVWSDLLDRSVLVRDCSSFSPRLRGCLRVTIGTAEEDDRFLKALEEVLVPR